MRSRTLHHRPDGQSGRRAGGAIVAVCLLAATACSSDGDKTTAESTSTAAPATAAEESVDEPTTTEPPETAPSTDAPTTDAPATTEPETEEPAVTASSDDGGASVSVVLTDGRPAGTPSCRGTRSDLDQRGQRGNRGKERGGDLHDLVIVKGDDPAALPVNEDGAVIEDDLPEDDFIGRSPWSIPVPKSRRRSISMPGATSSFATSSTQLRSGPSPAATSQDGMVSTFTVT